MRLFVSWSMKFVEVMTKTLYLIHQNLWLFVSLQSMFDILGMIVDMEI